PVDVLGVREERLVEGADPFERCTGNQHRTAAGPLGLVRRGRGQERRVAVSGVAPLVAAPRVVARARVPDATGGAVEDLRAGGTDALGARRVHERLEEVGLD